MSESRERVRAAIVGLGMGRNHIAPFRKHPQCEVVAVCDVNGTFVEDVRREFNIPRGFASIDDLLQFGDFDVVALALPNNLHEPVTIRFLEAGYHVLAEKPLALNAEQGRRIAEAVRRTGRKFALHMNQRMTPEHQMIRRAFDAGDLGEVYYIRTGWMRERGIPTWGAGEWFTRKERSGGGPLIDLGVHMLDSALYCSGFPKVTSVTGRTAQYFAERDLPGKNMDVEDFATAYIRCENDLVIALEASWAGFHDQPNEAFMHVYGSQAGAHRSTVFDEEWKPTTEFFFSRRRDGALSRETVEEMPGGLVSVQEDLIQAILDDRDPVCTVEQGVAVMEVIDAIYESARVGAEVRLAE